MLTRWQQPAGSTNTCGYDNRVIDLAAGGATPFRGYWGQPEATAEAIVA